MKTILFTLFTLLSLSAVAQSTKETEILKLSNQIFQWEVAGNIDSIEKVFNDKFVVVSASGDQQTKAHYIAQLKSGNFVHNSIDVSENSATISDNTATVVGKGTFIVTASGKKIKIRLSYIEVFTRRGVDHPWSVLAMHASAQPEK